MQKLDRNLNYAVVGLGVTGSSCVEFLTSHGCRVLAIDNNISAAKLEELKAKFSNCSFQTQSLAIPADIDLVLLSPGIDPQLPELLYAKQQGISIINDIELFARLTEVPVIAITGSNGKSTVAAMVAHFAQSCGVKVGLGGNIGIPALSLLAEQYELCVLELSSFQLELVDSLIPTAATVLNVTPDHLDRHASFADYKAAKLKIYNHAKNIIVNQDEKSLFPLPEQLVAKDLVRQTFVQLTTASVGTALKTNPVQDAREIIYFSTDDYSALNLDIPLIGEHNIVNALSALALAAVAGLPLTKCIAAIKTFVGLRHRCELVRQQHGITWINDSKGTNVAATIAAIKGTAEYFGDRNFASKVSAKLKISQGAKQDAKKNLIVILGGEAKGADFAELEPVVKQYCKAAILLGKAQHELKKALHLAVACHLVQDLKSCVNIAAEIANSGDIVLLSPACASFDMFVNFEDRGNSFKALVNDLC